MMYKRQCAVCGGIFYSPRAAAVTCSEICRRKRQVEINQQKRASKEVKQTQKTESKLDKINKIARSQGLSYGKYKALEYIKNHKV